MSGTSCLDFQTSSGQPREGLRQQIVEWVRSQPRSASKDGALSDWKHTKLETRVLQNTVNDVLTQSPAATSED